MEDTAKERAGTLLGSHEMVDAAVAVVTFAVGVAVMVNTGHLGASWVNGTPEPGYFPFRIGGVICLASATIFVRALLRARRSREVFVRLDRLRRVVAVLAPMLAYFVAIAYLGIYVASAIFVAGFMRVAGRYSVVKSVVVGVACSIALFWLFERQFLVPLPKGPLESWLGY
ncbi:MAG TPA: tripartite tricarboxylate transporter TctB family protein [Usitatibacter sp.]|nr:tripartite tricarboxylate transporter TctB family protein [Usitatibacter sp.]